MKKFVTTNLQIGVLRFPMTLSLHKMSKRAMPMRQISMETIFFAVIANSFSVEHNLAALIRYPWLILTMMNSFQRCQGKLTTSACGAFAFIGAKTIQTAVHLQRTHTHITSRVQVSSISHTPCMHTSRTYQDIYHH